jgi:NAD/NADP transhydrogenase alpha subunit
MRPKRFRPRHADDDDGGGHGAAAKVFVMGVGVAGLQAIATARASARW